MADRCTGHCCRLFYQARSPIEWKHKRRYAQSVLDRYAGDPTYEYKDHWREEIYTADMLIFVREQTHGQSLRGRWQHPRKGSRWYYYTCRHFDGQNCTQYASRPRMCSEYPHYGEGHACRYPQCTWHAGKYPHVKDVRGTRMIEEALY